MIDVQSNVYSNTTEESSKIAVGVYFFSVA